MPILKITVLDRDPLREDPETRYLRGLLQQTAGWNGGAGLIVTPATGEELRRRGLTEHYTVQSKEIPDA